MPIIAVILLTAAFWTAYWFIHMGGVEHFRERAAQRKEEQRKAEARERDRTALLRAIDDPRDAATVLMVLVARGGDPTAEQLATIEQVIARVFDFESDTAARMTQAQFIARSAAGFDDAAKIFADLFRKRLSAAEQRELAAMLRDVARLDGPSPLQSAAIESFERRLGFAPAG
jgi:hypothetical protein